jgi:hypothetical protein
MLGVGPLSDLPLSTLPSSAPPAGPSVVLEAFENTPAAEGVPGTGGPAWTDIVWLDAASTSGVTVTRTTSHVTEGTYSWRVQGATASFPLFNPSGFQDITATASSASTIDIDVYVTSINAADFVVLNVQDGTNTILVASSAGQTGAFTLSVDVTGFDFSNLIYAVVVAGDATGSTPLNGACDVYFDNLRTNAGGGGGGFISAWAVYCNQLIGDKMKKNVAGQKVGAQMVSATDGSAFTGTVTVYVTGDAGTQAIGSVGSGICTSEGNGYHTYAPAQAETNYDLVGFTFIGTGAVPASVQVYTDFPQTGDNFARIGAPVGASISADIAALPTDADVSAAVWNAATASYGTAGTYGLLVETNLDAAVTSRMATYTQPSGFLAATFPTGTIANTTNITAGTITTATNVTTVNGLAANVITAAATAADFGTEIAAAVWDRDATLSQTQGTFGQAIGDPVADTNTIYKAVVTDATGATVGVDVVALKAETVTILADTNDIQTRLPAALVSGRMDASVGAMAADVITAAATAADFGTEVGTAVWSSATRILTAGTNIALAKGTGVTGFNDLSAAQVNAEVDTALADVGVTLTVTGRIDAAISSRLASASYTAPDNASILLVKAKTDSLNFTVAGQVDANIQYVNDIAVTGNGETGTEWGPV